MGLSHTERSLQSISDRQALCSCLWDGDRRAATYRAMNRLKKASILVVEDDPTTLDFLVEILEESGHDCRTALDGIEALNIIQNEDFDVIISNVHMPGIDGLELMSRVREIAPTMPFIITSGYVDDHPPAEILEAGAQVFLKKPFKLDELTQSVNSILEARQKRGFVERPKQNFIKDK